MGSQGRAEKTFSPTFSAEGGIVRVRRPSLLPLGPRPKAHHLVKRQTRETHKNAVGSAERVVPRVCSLRTLWATYGQGAEAGDGSTQMAWPVVTKPHEKGSEGVLSPFHSWGDRPRSQSPTVTVPACSGTSCDAANNSCGPTKRREKAPVKLELEPPCLWGPSRSRLGGQAVSSEARGGGAPYSGQEG